MSFSSTTFAAFLVIAVLCYWGGPGRLQNWVLVAANLVFYSWWDPRLVVLITALILVQCFGARAISSQSSLGGRKTILIGCLIVNLGTLVLFKYLNFFLDNLNIALHSLGIQPLRHASIILPVGLSFYTFLLTAYTVDVYRRKVEASRDLIGFMAFASFFPTVLSGPIERASNLLAQLGKPRTLNWKQVDEGIWLICWGLFRKVVMADQLNALVSPVIGNPSGYNGAEILVMVLAFTFQIYLDFSSYSDIAIGSAKLLGLDVMLNFDLPYFSRSPQEFWRRWHISLSTWLRDYLYIPLGGNRKGERRTYVNLFLTMLLGGFWHGAAWSFLLWGGYHGLLLMGHRLLQKTAPSGKTWMPTFLSMIITFALVSYGWMLFRAESVHQIVYFSAQLISNLSITIRSLVWIQELSFIVVPLLIIETIQFFKREHLVNRLLTWWARPLAYAFMFYLYLTIGLSTKPQEFIYFQF